MISSIALRRSGVATFILREATSGARISIRVRASRVGGDRVIDPGRRASFVLFMIS